MKLRKKSQEQKDEIKRKNKTDNQNWNYWRFHKYWNKLE